MHRPTHLITVTRPVQNLNSGSPLLFGFLLISLALALFALSPLALAVIPAPDGGYPNPDTAEADNALFSLTTGQDNTAIGFQALFKDTTGHNNTAIGAGALFNNTTGSNNTATGLDALAANTTASNNTANGVDAESERSNLPSANPHHS